MRKNSGCLDGVNGRSTYQKPVKNETGAYPGSERIIVCGLEKIDWAKAAQEKSQNLPCPKCEQCSLETCPRGTGVPGSDEYDRRIKNHV